MPHFTRLRGKKCGPLTGVLALRALYGGYVHEFRPNNTHSCVSLPADRIYGVASRYKWECGFHKFVEVNYWKKDNILRV